MTKLRVVVADDHPVFREGLLTILSDVDSLEVVGEAADGVEALKAVEQTKPDVVLMDLKMPNLSGIDAISRVTTEHPAVRVLALTMNDDDESVLAALKAGAKGYLLKEATKDEIVQAVNTVAQGQAVFGASVTTKVLSFLANSEANSRPDAFPQLSERERSVLDLMCRGFDNASIARKLFVSDKTVRNNVSLVLTKLQVETRADAIALAQQKGFGQGT